MNQEKYKELCRRVDKKKSDCWYKKTEPIFRTQKVKCEADFIKLVAFAYSWMPTIPTWHQELNWGECERALKRLKNGEAEALKETLDLIVPSINNSIVGASKVLHFMYPDHVPIIDSNVVAGWRALFYSNGVCQTWKDNVSELPKSFGSYGSSASRRQLHIGYYVEYSKNLSEWARNLDGVSIRDIEEKLYLLGK